MEHPKRTTPPGLVFVVLTVLEAAGFYRADGAAYPSKASKEILIVKPLILLGAELIIHLDRLVIILMVRYLQSNVTSIQSRGGSTTAHTVVIIIPPTLPGIQPIHTHTLSAASVVHVDSSCPGKLPES